VYDPEMLLGSENKSLPIDTYTAIRDPGTNKDVNTTNFYDVNNEITNTVIRNPGLGTNINFYDVSSHNNEMTNFLKNENKINGLNYGNDVNINNHDSNNNNNENNNNNKNNNNIASIYNVKFENVNNLSKIICTQICEIVGEV
jgi:hypothetical protein